MARPVDVLAIDVEVGADVPIDAVQTVEERSHGVLPKSLFLRPFDSLLFTRGCGRGLVPANEAHAEKGGGETGGSMSGKDSDLVW